MAQKSCKGFGKTANASLIQLAIYDITLGSHSTKMTPNRLRGGLYPNKERSLFVGKKQADGASLRTLVVGTTTVRPASQPQHLFLH